MPKSMREALDRINKEDKKNRRSSNKGSASERRRDAETLKRKSESMEAVKGKSVTRIKSAKEKYDKYLDENKPKTGSTLKKIVLGMGGGGPGAVVGMASVIGSYMKSARLSRDETIQDLVDQGVSEDEARSVVDAAIRGNPDVARAESISSGRGGATERRSMNAQGVAQPGIAPTGQQVTQPQMGRYTPIYTPGQGYQNMYGPQDQVVQPQIGQGNQIVQASQQPYTGYGGYGTQNVIPANAQEFTQTPNTQTSQPNFWEVAERIAAEGR